MWANAGILGDLRGTVNPGNQTYHDEEQPVARPKVSLVSQRKTLDVALAIADREGLEALTIRRLAEELGINGASLYHHFRNKDEILVGVATLALEGVRTPTDPAADWQEWLLQNLLEFRRALLAHPNLMPLLVRRHAMRIGLREHNATAALLAVQGVTRELVLPLLESLEALAIGTVMYASPIDAAEDTDDAPDWQEDYPHLFALARQASMDHDETFDLVARSIIAGFAALIDATNGEPTPAGV